MIELVVALVIGAVLTGIAVSSISDAQGRTSVRGARRTFAALHARARATAIEGGTTTRMFIDLGGDSVALIRNGVSLDVVHFGGELDVDLRSGSSTLTLCMSSRGFANDACNSFTTAQTIEFWQNADSATVRLLPLGQLIF